MKKFDVDSDDYDFDDCKREKIPTQKRKPVEKDDTKRHKKKFKPEYDRTKKDVSD